MGYDITSMKLQVVSDPSLFGFWSSDVSTPAFTCLLLIKHLTSTPGHHLVSQTSSCNYCMWNFICDTFYTRRLYFTLYW